MKHIPLLRKEDADPEVKKVWDDQISRMGFDLAILHVTAHASNTFAKWLAFNGTVWEEEKDGMPLLLKEMAVAHAGVLSNSAYEWAHHGVNMLNRGGTQEQFDALLARDPKSDVFDETQNLVLQFTTEVVAEGRPTEATLTAMSEQFTSKQLTQLVFGICVYMMNSRLASLGGCEIGDDEDFGYKLPWAGNLAEKWTAGQKKG